MTNLLDYNLDDLADLPEFKPFPNGAHTARIKFEEKEINGNPAIELSLTGVSTEELADPNDTPIKPGDTASVLFMLNNEFGQGALKAVLKPLGNHFGIANLRQIMEAANGTECLVVTKQRQNKDKTATYMSVASLSVL